MTHKMERAQDALDRKASDFAQVKEQLEREKNQLIEQLESKKLKLGEEQEKNMQLNLDSSREQALLQQQVEFLNRKNEDLTRQKEEIQLVHDERLKTIRQEIYDDSQAQVDRVNSEKELWEQKYEQKRKALKELENSLGKKNTELEKQCTQLKAQLTKSEGEKTASNEAAKEEIQALQAQMANLDNSAGQAFYYGSSQAEELMKYK